jgi:hypothetical protein
VKKNLIVILLAISFFMVVFHEMIPHHHHHDMDDIELFSHQHHNNKQDNNSGTNPIQHFPFPAHHHVSTSEGFDIARIGTSLERNITFTCFFTIPDYLSCIPDSEPPENTFYTVITIPLSALPFIISPNSMRGSPSVA